MASGGCFASVPSTMRRFARNGLPAIAFTVLVVACQTPPPPAPTVSSAPATKPAASKPAGPTAADAKAFAEQTNADLKRLYSNWERAEWVKSTYITHDTEVLAAHFHEKLLAYTSKAVKDATPVRRA